VASATLPSPTTVPARPVRGATLWRVLRHRNGGIGAALVAVLVLTAIVGPVLLSGSPSADFGLQNLSNTMAQPSAAHWLGTDQLGRDEFTRLIEGARYTIFIGVVSVLVAGLLGLIVGAVSGYAGGWFDLLTQRVVEIILAFPGFLLALALVAVLGSGMTNVVISVATAAFPRFVRVTRAAVIVVKESTYIEAARSVGVPPMRLLTRHIVPNALSSVIVQAPLEVGSAVMTAAGLGFLGLGVAQPTPEWGSMMGDARELIFTNASLITYPGVTIMLLILAFNLLGDALRDVLDPKHAVGRAL
jgi:ABC-type dipeptide/oligopeptide/nickel transport system permease subunit